MKLAGNATCFSSTPLTPAHTQNIHVLHKGYTHTHTHVILGCSSLAQSVASVQGYEAGVSQENGNLGESPHLFKMCRNIH